MASIWISVLMLTASSLAPSNAESPDSFGPTLDSARENGPQIFNAVHNAMREFGSALEHNGMSLFPAVIPEGVTLYHGAETRDVPKGPEWLAFEIEHAEAFAYGRRRPGNGSDGEHPGHRNLALSIQLQEEDEPPRSPPNFIPGYLHVYQAVRPLNVLYIDGTSAGKTNMGTVDTQDILLTNMTNHSDRGPGGDFERADELCKLGHEWKIDGFIRMEPGFEVIYCDFTDGLRQVSTSQRPPGDDPGNVDNTSLTMFEWARAAAQRYKGIGSSRVVLDYSSMVSAFFYPINLTNPDPKRPELPRLLGASDEEMRVVRGHVGDSVVRSISHRQAPVDWQGVTDMIVARYEKRLSLIAQADSIDLLRDEVNHLLNTYIDYSEVDEEFSAARQRCTEFYLRPAQVQTPEDHLIYAAIETTAAAICAALFKARQLTVEDSKSDESTLNAAKEVVVGLMDTLRWSEWKECGKCQVDEVCFVAMWPFGNVEDHYNPSCLNLSAVAGRHNYWRDPGKTPGHRPPPQSCAKSHGCQDNNDLSNEEL